MSLTMRCPACGADLAVEDLRCPACDRMVDTALLRVKGEAMPETSVVVRPRTYTIGRAPGNDLVFPDPSISRTHARLTYQEGRYVLEDAGSRHGITVDDRRVSRVELTSGMTLLLGRLTVVFTQAHS